MHIPSDITYVRKVSAKVENFLKEKGVDSFDVFDIRLCVEEAVKNAIIHGNKENKNLKVKFSYELKNCEFIFEIEDEGKGFDYTKVPDPTRDENLLKTGGRGVFLIGKLMDKVEYKKKGNKICMIKTVTKKKGACNAD